MHTNFAYQNGGVHQQAQSNHVPTAQGSMSWDASQNQWVSAPSAYSSTGSYHSTASMSSASMPNQFPPPPHHPVSQPSQPGDPPCMAYYRYHLYWKEQENVQRSKGQLLAPGCPEAEEAKRVSAWAEYYASQSLHAYYYYQQNPHLQPAQTSSTQQPPYQPQPSLLQVPAPPQVAVRPQVQVPAAPMPPPFQQKIPPKPKPHVAQKVVEQKKHGGNSGDDGEYPESLRSYMRKVLSHCKTDTQRRDAQASVERLVEKAITNETMFSTDWDSKAIPDFLLSSSPPSSATKSNTTENTPCKHFPPPSLPLSNGVQSSSFNSLYSQPKKPVQTHPSSSLQGKGKKSPNKKKKKKLKKEKEEGRWEAEHNIYNKFKVSPLFQRMSTFNNSAATSPPSSSSVNSQSSNELNEAKATRVADQDSNEKKNDNEGGGWETDHNICTKFKVSPLFQTMSTLNNSAAMSSPASTFSSHLQSQSSNEFKEAKATRLVEEDYVQLTPSNSNYYGNVHHSHSNLKNNSVKVNSIKRKNQKSKKLNPNSKKKQKTRHSLPKMNGLSKNLIDGFECSSDILTQRANRFSTSTPTSSTCTKDLDKYMGLSIINGNHTKKLDESDFEKMTVKGLCMKLEKEYLRLTSPPSSEKVRPQQILEKHLQNLKTKWKNGACEYAWLCSQLKAIRQDMTVQRIYNFHTTEVYETHARIALEQGDLNEYNQCQTQLKYLYPQITDPLALKNENEFLAYRIIYYVYLSGNKKYDGGSSDMLKIMLGLTKAQKKDPCVSHALKVRIAVAEYDYHSFFLLQNNCPKMGAYLIDFLVPTIRTLALQRICKAFRPTIPLKYVLKELGFEENELDIGTQWLRKCGCKVLGNVVNTKDTVLDFSALDGKNSLI